VKDFRLNKKLFLPSLEAALPDREEAVDFGDNHAVFGCPIKLDPSGPEQKAIMFGMGCFWGAEKLFWEEPGVTMTAVGYAGGYTRNPNYEEVCSGQTGHTEVVLVHFDTRSVSVERLMELFLNNHHPGLGMRQGNDVGTQYRSAVFLSDPEFLEGVQSSLASYQILLWNQGYGGITTEIQVKPRFYFAESWHQQYLSKNPDGYCHHLTCSTTGLPEYKA
jgi:peptide-methionine (S)-S-oxide reductase